MGKVAVAQHLQAIVKAADDPPLHQQLRRHHGAGLEAVAEIPNVNNRVFLLKSIGKAAPVGQPPVQWRLAALEARPHRVARVLALRTAARRLAVPAPDAAPNPLTRLNAAGDGFQFSQSHRSVPPPSATSSTSTR